MEFTWTPHKVYKSMVSECYYDMMYAVTLPSPHTHKHIHKHNNIHSQYIVPLMMKHTDVSIQVSLANGVHATIYFNVSHLSFDSLNCMTMGIVLWYSLALRTNTIWLATALFLLAISANNLVREVFYNRL